MRLSEQLKAMGYDYLQVSGLPIDAKAIARVSKATDMPIYLSHSPLDKILNETEKVMEENAAFGCKNIGLGSVSYDIVSDKARLVDLTEKLERVGERMKQGGFTFFYHHHHTEFYKHGDQTAIDYILRNAPSVHVITDTYWVYFGGENPVAFLHRVSGRCECMHLKDYRLMREDSGWVKPNFAPVGSGTLDFPAIVSAAFSAGTKYFFVEQDDAGEYPDPLGEVKKSIDYIKENL